MTNNNVDEENKDETPARRRSRQESNLRRRIYDAWNVLKAASIIVERGDEKHFSYNPAVLQEMMLDDMDGCEMSSEDDLI